MIVYVLWIMVNKCIAQLLRLCFAGYFHANTSNAPSYLQQWAHLSWWVPEYHTAYSWICPQASATCFMLGKRAIIFFEMKHQGECKAPYNFFFASCNRNGMLLKNPSYSSAVLQPKLTQWSCYWEVIVEYLTEHRWVALHSKVGLNDLVGFKFLCKHMSSSIDIVRDSEKLLLCSSFSDHVQSSIVVCTWDLLHNCET